MLHVFPHWNWPDRVGRKIEVRAHSNCDEVELWLNGTSQGRKLMPVNGHLSWQVPYTPGRLEARGYKAGKAILHRVIETTGEARLEIEAR
ncbi:MAG: DUF4982 domain-containing protein [Opitutaceae bacterium]|nr:DUF4982 domain-containing protein [Opitutaceae bacterium]